MNIYTKIGIITIALFFVFNTIFAASLGGGYSTYKTRGGAFGGKIIATRAREIPVDYTCKPEGTTIEIKSLKGPTSYFIPGTTSSKSNTTPTVGQSILGKYSGTTTITCEKESSEVGGSWVSSGTSTTSKVTVVLPTITLFGTSKR